MTTEVGQDTGDLARYRTTAAPPEAPLVDRVTWQLRALQSGSIVLAAAGVIVALVEITTAENLHLTMASATCFVLAGLGGTLLGVRALLADRGEFYRRGELDGWMKGWHGQDPDTDHPLVR